MIRPAALFLVLLATGCTTINEATPPDLVPLDDLIAFRDPELCEEGEAFSAMLDAMATVTDGPGLSAGRIAVPDRFRAAFGEISTRDHPNGGTVVSVAVRGSWRGASIIALHQFFPEGGDPPDFTIEFDEPIETVASRLTAARVPVRAGEVVEREIESVYTRTIILLRSPDDPGRSLFGCGYA